jgi:multiple sugar transport system permease protein
MPTRGQRLLLLLPLALIVVPFLIAPALFGFFASFTNYAPAQASVHFIGLANYLAVVRDSEFGAAYRNIAVLILTAVPIELCLGFLLAYLLREPFRGRGVARVLFLVPWLVSPIANGVMWHYVLNSQSGLFAFALGWLSIRVEASPLGLHGFALPTVIATDIWRLAPLVSFLLLPGLLSIPTDDWDQAMLEGASVFAQIRHIAIPRIFPLLLTVAMLLVGATFGTFENVLMMTGGGPGTETVTPGLSSYQQAFQINNWSVGATGAWLIVAAVFVIGIIYLRWTRSAEQV